MTNAAKDKATFAVCVKCRNLRGERARPRGAGVRLGGPAHALLVSSGGQGDLPASLRHRDQLPADAPGGIRTSTRDPLLRLLYVGVALILRNVWVWLHWQAFAQPRRGGRRIDLSQLRFRQMLVWLQHHVEAWLGICEEVVAHALSGSDLGQIRMGQSQRNLLRLFALRFSHWHFFSLAAACQSETPKGEAKGKDADKKPKPKFTVSKETTWTSRVRWTRTATSITPPRSTSG